MRDRKTANKKYEASEKGKAAKERYRKSTKGKLAVKKSEFKCKYGMTLKQYDIMLETQNGVCAICGHSETTINRFGGVDRLCVDHNHITGRLRGLLCHNCNLVIGNAKESINTLSMAIKYLSDHDQ